MKNMLLILFFSAIVSSTCHASNVNDFCVADLSGPEIPSGYHCKPLNTVTSSDFKYTLRPSNASVPSGSKYVLSEATVNEFPGVNGLDMALARVDIEKGGFFPWHTHPGGDEILIVVEGEMVVGFVTPTKAYVNTLKTGDVTVFPRGQSHFLVNSGKGRASAIAAFNSPNPRLYPFYQLLFANDVPSDIVAQTSSLDLSQVKKLKARYGGSG